MPKTIIQLPAASGINNPDVFLLRQNGSDKQMSASGVAMAATGTGAPGSTPTKIGDIYVDTDAPNVYISTGISSSADWLIVS